MTDAKTITIAEKIICNLSNDINQAIAVLSLGVAALPSIDFDDRITNAFYAVETILNNASEIISDADKLIMEEKNK